MKKIKNSDAIVLGIYVLVIFISMFVFYTSVKMLTISDPDDWTYISKIRMPFPSLNEYNPAKVFPETIMGLCGYFAAYVIYPIIGDYTWSMTFVYASVVSLVIAVSIVCVCTLIKNLLYCNLWTSISGSLVFFLLHFIIFKAGENNNNFLLTASNLNCFMNYTIPLLSCFIMAMFIFKEYINCENDKPCNLGSGKKTIIIGLVLLWSYLNIFSNMICNIILVAPITFLFLRNALIALKGKSFNKKFFIENYMYEYILLLEMICLFFEGNGNRAASFEVNWMSAIENTLHDLKDIVGIIDKKIIVLCVLIVVVSLIVHVLGGCSNQKFTKILLVGLYSFALTFIYICLLYTRINSHYFIYMECLYPIFIYFLFIVCVASGYIIDKFKAIRCFMPLILYMSICLVVTRDYKPSSSGYFGNDDIRHMVNENIVSQYIEADRRREATFELHIPEEGLGQYWFTGERISKTMFRHGVTSKLIPVTCVLEPMEYFFEE